MNQDQNVITIYNQFKSWIDGTNELNASSIVILVTKSMKCAEEEITLRGKGDYKKSVVLQVIKLVVNDSKLSDEAKSNLLVLIDTIVPSMIDTMILIAQKRIDIGKTVASAKNSCLGCFKC